MTVVRVMVVLLLGNVVNAGPFGLKALIESVAKEHGQGITLGNDFYISTESQKTVDNKREINAKSWKLSRVRDLLPAVKNAVWAAVEKTIQANSEEVKSAIVDPEDQVMGLVETGGKKLVYVRKETTWKRARKECQRMGGDLASDLTRADYDALNKVLTFRVYSRLFSQFGYFVGAEAVGDGVSKTDFRWISGNPIASNMWNALFPDGKAKNDKMRVTFRSGRYHRGLENSSGRWYLPFICQF